MRRLVLDEEWMEALARRQAKEEYYAWRRKWQRVGDVVAGCVIGLFTGMCVAVWYLVWVT